MNKIFKLILIFVVAVGFLVPQNVKATSVRPENWVTYRTELETWLRNYRASSTPGGPPNTCTTRTTTNPNGTSDCLSARKPADIINQLDRDHYWSLAESAYGGSSKTPGSPLARRKYLLATKDQPYVMRKVVMYFEEHPTVNNPGAPNVWLYGQSVTADQAMALVNDSFAGYAIMAQDIIGVTLGGYRPGDNDIRALAFNPGPNVGTSIVPVYNFTLRPKSTITAATLDRIYKAARLAPYINYRPAPNWTTAEINAMAPAVVKDLNAIDDARKHKTSPVYAKITQDSMQMAFASMGLESKLGGMAVSRGVVSEFAAFAEETYQVGRYQVKTTAPVMESIFSRSGADTAVLLTGESPIHTQMRNIASAMDLVYKTVGPVFPEGPGLWTSDQILADSFSRTTFIVRQGIIDSLPGNTIKGAPGAFNAPNIYFSDLNTNNITVYVHEYLHKLRWLAASRKGIPEAYSWALEDYNQWMTDRITGRNFPVYSARNIETMAGQIAKKNGISLVEADNRLVQIYFNNQPQAIDQLLGRPGFWDTYVNMRNQWQVYVQQWRASSMANEAAANQALINQKAAISRFVNQ